MIFVDTSALLALLDRDDAFHAAAAAILPALAAEDHLLSHEYILVEATALAQRRLGMGAVRRLVDDLLPLIQVAWIDTDLHAEAREAQLAAGRRNVSLVDWTSFLVMRRNGVRRAFTFDADFEAEGFEAVPAA